MTLFRSGIAAIRKRAYTHEKGSVCAGTTGHNGTRPINTVDALIEGVALDINEESGASQSMLAGRIIRVIPTPTKVGGGILRFLPPVRCAWMHKCRECMDAQERRNDTWGGLCSLPQSEQYYVLARVEEDIWNGA